MKKNCEYCGTEFEAKRETARFDTEKCKKASQREKERIEAPIIIEEVELEPVLDECPSPYPIDIAYWNHRAELGLETELGKEREKVCVNEGCKKEFKTQLQLMRFCSRDCYPFELKGNNG